MSQTNTNTGGTAVTPTLTNTPEDADCAEEALAAKAAAVAEIAELAQSLNCCLMEKLKMIVLTSSQLQSALMELHIQENL